ncbi:MAG TPA: VOC family protein [Candidatus Dormibacteraeota bacterium]|nr:VOC family protein [Candidatus Dormibacteraeota bacterium]
MAEISLEPYIFFKGNCRPAMEFYKSVLGGELTMQAYSEVPGSVPGAREINQDWLMHAALEGEVKIMGSDTEQASPEAKKITLSLVGTDEEKLSKMFEGLSQGGKVTSPLKKEFWGDTFGTLTDKFGVEWMVNINAEKK